MRLEYGSRFTLYGTLYDHVLTAVTDWGESFPSCMADLRVLGRPVFRLEPETWGQRAWVAHGGWCDVQGYERARGVLAEAGFEVGSTEKVEGRVGKSTVRNVGCTVRLPACIARPDLDGLVGTAEPNDAGLTTASS